MGLDQRASLARIPVLGKFRKHVPIGPPMTFEQITIVAILAAMLVAYASERFRIELVAMCGLAAGFLLGVVPVQTVFQGFANPAVITVIEVLLVVGVLARTRVMDGLARTVVATASSERTVLLLLGATAASISVFMNNIGALALVFPVAMSVCARMSIPPAKILMALSFSTLLGGMCSLTGTPANLVVNQWVVDQTGRSLGYFELATVGGPLALAGLALLIVIAPRVFARAGATPETVADAGPNEFVVERELASGAEAIGMHVPQFEDAHGLAVLGVVRNGAHVFARRQDIVLAAQDILLMAGTLARFQELEDANELMPSPVEAGANVDEPATLEFVVMPDSLLLGSRVEDLSGYSQAGIEVVALASRRGRIEGRLTDIQLAMGDVVVLAGDRADLRRVAADCGLLALSPRRNPPLKGSAVAAVAVFGAGVLASALGLAPTEIAFGGVILALAVMGQLRLRSALQDMNWTIIVLLACMIPLGLAVEQTGAAGVIADAIADWLPTNSPLVVVVTILLLAVAITPFIDNVSTAIVLSPIAAGLASRTGVPVEPALMAVAIGVSLDFLTPFGHHNNAVVMGAGGYRFMDFPRLGLPLTVLCIFVATAVFGVMLHR
ncbi:SLC13 family permease [Leptolyngbya sp. 15MV]|nr:SLC13 family permease [Leptolyngbya sp. 15MV]